MYNQQYTPPSPPTQALMQAVEELKQSANPSTPSGGLSIAGKTMQAAQAKMQPQMPPQGIMQLSQDGQPQSQGIAGFARNAATGAAIQQMQQQEAQQALMALAKQQQQQPQMMAEGGVAGLRTSGMEFAEGGIIPTMPADVESLEMASIRNRQKQLEELQRNSPDFSAQQLAALDADRQARQQIAEKQTAAAVHPIFDMAAAWRRGGAGAGLEAVKAGRLADANRMEAARVAEQLDAAARIKIAEAKQAKLEGNIGKLMEVDKDLANIRNQQRQLQSSIYGHDVSKYGHQTKAEVDREQIASAEKRSQADREARALESKAEMGSRERIAALGLDRAEKAQNLRQYLDAMNSSDMKKLGESVASAEKRKSADAPALRKQLNEKRANYAKYYKLTPQEAASAFEGAGASASTAGAAELKYNPKTGKIE